MVGFIVDHCRGSWRYDVFVYDFVFLSILSWTFCFSYTSILGFYDSTVLTFTLTPIANTLSFGLITQMVSKLPSPILLGFQIKELQMQFIFY